MRKLLLVLVIIIVGFGAYVASRPATFHYQRSGVINAAPEKIFPYLHNFKLGSEWVPYEKIDPKITKTYSGPAEGVGAIEEFVGNNKIGAGKLEILKEIPNSFVEIKLEMTKPLKATNIIHYILTPEGTQTRFTWSMEGNANFVSKLIGVFINCEKMVGEQFEDGIQNLKTLVETTKT